MKLLKHLISLILLVSFLSSFTLSNFNKINTPPNEKPYIIVGQMPHFPGGKLAMQRYIAQNLVYPYDALKNNVHGKVNVEFVVDKDGSLVEVRTVGSKIGYGLEEQAITLFRTMPKWVPGKQDGVIVPVYMMIPIVFTL